MEAVGGVMVSTPKMSVVIPYFAGDPSQPLTLISGLAGGISNEALYLW